MKAVTTMPDRHPNWTGHRVGYAITVGVVALAGAVVSIVSGVLFVGASAGCGGSHGRFVCSVDGQQVVFWLPWAGWVLAIVSAVVYAVIAAGRSRLPWPGLGIGAVVYAVPFLIAYSIAAP